MPVDRRAALQLGLLLLAVPVQILVSKWMSSSEAQRSHAIRNLMNDAVGFKDRYLSWKSWHKWCMDIWGNLQGTGQYFDGADDPNGESPAVEVMNFKDPQGYFAGSPEPRDPRPPAVKFRIGQVIKHKLWGYRGVIIGWDPKARAPENWIKQMHMSHQHWRDMPNYSILVDTRDRMTPQVTYVPEENIEVVSNTRVMHPEIEDFFEGFDGAQYLPRPWLKAVYPHDS